MGLGAHLSHFPIPLLAPISVTTLSLLLFIWTQTSTPMASSLPTGRSSRQTSLRSLRLTSMTSPLLRTLRRAFSVPTISQFPGFWLVSESVGTVTFRRIPFPWDAAYMSLTANSKILDAEDLRLLCQYSTLTRLVILLLELRMLFASS